MALVAVNQLLQLSTKPLYIFCHPLSGEGECKPCAPVITAPLGTVIPLAYYRCYAGSLNPWIVFQLTAKQGNSPDNVRLLK